MQNNYQKTTPIASIEANVTKVMKMADGCIVLIDQKIVYPGGGGQPMDIASIIAGGQSYPIREVKDNEWGQSLYIDCNDRRIYDGDNVIVNIDIETRIVNSKAHSFGHLLTSVVSEVLYPELTPVKGFHYPPNCYIEFSGEPGQEIILSEIQKAVNKVVLADLPITSKVINKESITTDIRFPLNFNNEFLEGVRVIKVGSFMEYPCGGTHMQRTGSLRDITVTKTKKKKGNLRVSYYIGLVHRKSESVRN